jgi:hypothetical protein
MALRTLVVVSVGILALTVYAADEIKLEGIKCIMNPDHPAQAAQAVDHKGGKIFFCCENCPPAFAIKVKTDQKVIARANHQLVATGQAKQENCPFTGDLVQAGTSIKVQGAEIAFCCEDCKAKGDSLKDDAQLTALFGDEAFQLAKFTVKKTAP